jgi:hypothetical protein
MAVLGSRKAKVGISVSILLMFCIVMFIGSLFYLTIDGPWNLGNEIEHIPPTLPIEYTSDPEDEPDSVENALLDLCDAGCTIVSSSINFNEYDVKSSSFHEFKDKVLKNRIVILAEIKDETLLLVLQNGQLWYWKP